MSDREIKGIFTTEEQAKNMIGNIIKDEEFTFSYNGFDEWVDDHDIVSIYLEKHPLIGSPAGKLTKSAYK
jgi:hypothetical protein